MKMYSFAPTACKRPFALTLILLWLLFLGAFWILGTYSDWGFNNLPNQLWLSRAVVIITLSLALLDIRPTRKKFNTFLKNSDSSLQVATFRLLFFGGIITFVFLNPSVLKTLYQPWLDAPDAVRHALPPFGDLFSVVPLNEPVVELSVIIWVTTLFFSFVGFASRLSLLVFATASFYLFGIPQYFGEVAHYHFLVWFPLLLSFGASGRKLSIDSLIGTYVKSWQQKVAVGNHYIPFSSSLVVASTLALLSIIYFFPGFWKAWNVGLPWASPVNVRGIIATSIIHKSFNPILSSLPDFFLYAGGCLTLTFELFFWYFISIRKARIYVLVAGLFFHICIYLFMGINFLPMTTSYVCILYVTPKGFENKPCVNTNLFNGLRRNAVALVIVLVLTGANFVFGALKITSGWPLACYPTFDTFEGTQFQQLVFYPSSKCNRFDSSEFKRSFGIARFNNFETEIIELHGKGLLNSDYYGLPFLENALFSHFKCDSVSAVVETCQLEQNSFSQYEVIDTRHVLTWKRNDMPSPKK